MTTQNRRPVLRCVLSNAAHPEYGQVTVPFPIPAQEYERTLELLAAMRLGHPTERDSRVDELESGFPILTRLEKVGANLDELDYLARRLDSFDGYEAAQFQAMAVRLGTFDMTDLINLTFCCQQATVITDFSDLEAIGQTHILTVNGGHMPVDEPARVDGRMEALKLILNERGTITPYGVVYNNGMELEQLYREGGPFPGYADREYSMLLEASAGEGQSTLLLLPDSQARLERLLGRAGIQYSSQVRFRVVDSTLPGAVFNRIPVEHLPILGLNRLCQAAERIAPEDLKTLVHLLAGRDQPSHGPSMGDILM